jgi:hypothetical protein
MPHISLTIDLDLPNKDYDAVQSRIHQTLSSIGLTDFTVGSQYGGNFRPRKQSVSMKLQIVVDDIDNTIDAFSVLKNEFENHVIDIKSYVNFKISELLSLVILSI